MPNLNLSATQRDAIFRKKGFFVDLVGRREAMRNFLRDAQSRILEMFEQQGKLSNWKFMGAKIGGNVDSAGFLYIDATVVGPNITVTVWKDSAKTLKVAESAATAFPVTALVLAEQNTSGLTGTVDVAAAIVSDTDIKLLVIQDAPRRLEETWKELDEDITQQVKGAIRADLLTRFPVEDGELTSTLTLFSSQFLQTWLVDYLNIPSDFASSIHSYVYTTSAGAVSIASEEGILGFLKRVMVDNTTPIKVKPNTASIGAAVADPENIGLLTFSGLSALQHALPGTLVLSCIDETIGSARFAIENDITDLINYLFDGTRVILADNNAQLYQAFQDGPTGAYLTIGRGAVSESGDASALFSAYSGISGESSGNTDVGKVYFKVTRQATAGAEWLIELFKNAGMAAADRIAFTTTALGAGNISISVSGSGFSITFDFQRTNAAAAMPVIGNTYGPVTLDLKSPRLGDRWYLPVINDLAGAFQTFMARYAKASLNGVAVENVDDAFAKTYPVVARSD